MLTKYTQFVESKKKSGQDILDSLTPQRASIAHMLAGVQEEMMEAKKALSKEDEVNLKEELGDISFYLVGLATDYGLTVSAQFYPEFDDSFEDIVTMVKRDIYYEKPIDLELLSCAISDMLAQTDNLAKEYGTTLEALLQQNQDKLNKRYKGNYSDKQAQERADKQ